MVRDGCDHFDDNLLERCHGCCVEFKNNLKLQVRVYNLSSYVADLDTSDVTALMIPSGVAKEVDIKTMYQDVMKNVSDVILLKADRVGITYVFLFSNTKQC